MIADRGRKNKVAVLQVRVTSSRLPAKAMLPIRGYPMVVLAAKRASNRGLPIIVVTSEHESDDALIEMLEQNDISYFRGSLTNVLERITLALKTFSDDTQVFRLTADNVFPDGELIEELSSAFEISNSSYMCCGGRQSGLPYGLSVEAMKLSSLREAVSATDLESDLEHVTPYIRRKYGVQYFEKYQLLSMSHYRCTVDSLDDYLVARNIFRNVDKPIDVSFRDLISRLPGTRHQPDADMPVSKLVFGSAQLGLNYGIANAHGQPDSSMAERMLKLAISNGVQYLDTARAYGSSEQVIGRVLDSGWKSRVKIITKLDPLEDLTLSGTYKEISRIVESSVLRSLYELKVDRLDVLMLHRADHLTLCKGMVWRKLQEFRELGLVLALGASVQSPEEMLTVIENRDIEYIQLPFNILDWRWKRLIPLICEQQKERKLIIHVRSPLLQGLLACSGDTALWARAHVDERLCSDIQNWLLFSAKRCNREDVVDLCFSYLLSQPWINGIAVGSDSDAQLTKNMRCFSKTLLNDREMNEIIHTRPTVEEKTLDPSLWNKSI